MFLRTTAISTVLASCDVNPVTLFVESNRLTTATPNERKKVATFDNSSREDSGAKGHQRNRGIDFDARHNNQALSRGSSLAAVTDRDDDVIACGCDVISSGAAAGDVWRNDVTD